MKASKRILGIIGISLSIFISAFATTSFAADKEEALSSAVTDYSYLKGQKRSESRNALYAQAAMIEDENERKLFLIEHGISDTEYSEEAAASYSYVTGRDNGISHRSEDDNEDTAEQSAYSYLIGRQRGQSYNR